MSPQSLDKYLYINNTPTWFVRILYVFAIVSWCLVILGFSPLLYLDAFYRWFVGPILLLFTIYHGISYGLNLFYKKFDIANHEEKIRNYWVGKAEPSVDIFLPIAGEDIEVLKNTWKYVSQLRYANKRVYLLDDSKENCDIHKEIAEGYGFVYMSRPNKGEMKKAGNLKYAFERTVGEFITIFDADFAPHPDFLHDLLPYTADPKVGIVQSPQFFDSNAKTCAGGTLAGAAAYQEEFFYRVIQVARDRFNGAICCGSNAIYRRAALDEIGGPRQVTASEDSRTGFALLAKGWVTRYIPVILALGICPDTVYAYYHQQHRWCRGRTELITSREFLFAPVSIPIKLCNISGFLAFFTKPFDVLLSFQLFWTLFVYNDFISIRSATIFYPYLVFSLVLLPIFHIARFRKEVFQTSIIQLFATSHSMISTLMGEAVAWVPTNAKHSTVSSAFRQTLFAVSTYIFIYFVLIAFAFRDGLFHALNYNYYSIQFWIIWNLSFAALLLWQMYKTVEDAKQLQISRDGVSNRALTAWRLRTAGVYLLLLLAVFYLISIF